MFIATVIADWLWALYIIHTANKRAFKAALVSVYLTFIGSFITLSYVSNRWLLIATLLGAFVGTYLSIRFSKRKATNDIQ